MPLKVRKWPRANFPQATVYQNGIRPTFFAALVYTLGVDKYFLGGSDQFLHQIEAAFVLVVLVLLVTVRSWTKNSQAVFLVAVLALLPYAVAFGTGNSIFTQIIVSLAPWGVLLASLVNLSGTNSHAKFITTTLFTTFIMITSSQIISSGFRSPYHLAQPLSEQSHQILVGNLGRVKVDSETAIFIRELDTIVSQEQMVPGRTFLGLYNIPGVALILKAIPPVSPWLNNSAQLDAVLRLEPTTILKSTVVCVRLNLDGSFPELPKSLGAFPANFRYCGEVTYPFGNQKIQV